MLEQRAKYVGWSLGLIAIMAAVLVFPAIAGSASAQRDAAEWQNRAAGLDDAHLIHTAKSSLASDLALLQMVDTVKADYALTEDLLTYNTDNFKQYEVDVAEHEVAEYECLSEAIYYEARSETLSGQKAVAEVILNRVASKHFPASICGVVYEGSERNTGCQFSFTCDGSMDIVPRGSSWTRSQNVAKLAMTGGITAFTDRATHYHTTAVNPKWADKMRMTKHVGSHVFYRFAPRNYKPSAPLLTVAPPS